MKDTNNKRIIYVTSRQDSYLKLEEELRFQKTLEQDEHILEIVINDAVSAEEIFIDIWNIDPVVVIFDFHNIDSDQTLYYLAKLIRQDNKTKQINTLGIHDLNNKNITMKKSLTSGIRYNIVRSGEIEHSSNIIRFLLDSNLDSLNNYCTCKIEHDEKIEQDLRISYACNEYFRIETNTPLEIGQKIIINNHELEVFSDEISTTVSKEDDNTIYYNYRYTYKLEINYNEIRLYDPAWLKDLNKNIIPKSNRILIFDPTLTIYKNSLPTLEMLPFTLKVQTSFENLELFIERFNPNLVCIQSAGIKEEDQRTIEELKKLSGETPIIIFGTTLLASEVSPNTLVFKEDICFNLINSLSLKITENSKPKNSNIVYFKHSDSNSIFSFSRDIKITSLNEHIIEFNCKDDIPLETVFSIKGIDIFNITIIARENNLSEKCYSYKAIIHSISETSIINIRNFIYKIFFKEIDQKREQELKEFIKKKEEYNKQNITS